MNVNAADTLIARHPALAAYREQLSGARPETAASTASQARAAEGGGPLSGTPEPYLTIDGLKKAWGETDSHYDLNDDGTVDVQDLLKLLSEGGTMTDPNAPITVDGLMKDWGTVNSVYDLDHDGTVNVQDLLTLLAAGGEMAAPPPPPHGRAAGAVNGSRDDSAPAVAGPAAAPTDSIASPVAHEPTAVPPTASAEPKPVSTDAAVRTMSDLLISRLEKAGYTHRPPANLHGILDRFQFKAEHRQSIIDRIAQRYPNGLGIQARA